MSILAVRYPIYNAIRRTILGIKRLARRCFVKKYDAELAFWQSRFELDQGRFKNDHYQSLMLGMAQESDDRFLAGKIVADFGCGPRGSLTWARSAAVRIGIDVLADRYADAFADNITSHDMVYVKSTEKTIPLPTGFVNVMFTLNAIDHVDDFETICAEILRVLKPGGEFIASFNLEEPASEYEPQQLTEQRIKDQLLDHLDVVSYRVTGKRRTATPYAPFFQGELAYQPGEEGYLWVRARKPLAMKMAG